jgi:hypothetical protein
MKLWSNVITRFGLGVCCDHYKNLGMYGTLSTQMCY